MNINGDYLEVVIERKRIKNIYFRIKDNKYIYVTCPKFVSEREINKLLNANLASLEKMYIKSTKKDDIESSVYYLGKKYDYVYFKRVMFEDNIAFGPSIEDINKYLYKNALKYFETRLALYVTEFPNLPKFRLRVRIMKTRWGVCNKKSMTVTLNTLLIHKSPHLIDYVICHELSHFEHMDHSKEFWDEVKKHYPNYKQARKELKD